MIASLERMTDRFCRDTASAFVGICALSYRYDRPYPPHITVPHVCLFSMPNPTFISKASRPLSFRYDNPYGFLIDFFLIFCGRSLIDMTPTRFRIDMMITEIFLSRWLNSPIEMTATSYWYEGKERGFLTLCYLSIWVSFFLSLIQKIWRSSSQKESHLYKGYDRSFWASKILSMG